jgi:hypothetical protein
MPKPTKRKQVEDFILAYEALHKSLPSREQIAKELDVSHATIEVVLIPLKEMREKKKSNPIKFTKAQQKQVEAAIAIRLKVEVDKIREAAFPRWKQEVESARKMQHSLDKVIDGYKPVFTDTEFSNIMRCLHPDSRSSVTDELLKIAFQTFMARKERLLTPKKVAA